ncbi:CATRA conflict system CASPASE/TPR repeat-associated protein [Streptomyces sp. NPDC051105]|uniref:CATRA conflict system CASPASE/TPR repeat-associated protein n=1 Tax=Streptomyces sp. NPDC051105 TaxID=3154843 RepID=UPI00342DD6F7
MIRRVPTTSKPALLVVCFAPARAGSEAAHARLGTLWRGCRALGMTGALPGAAVGPELPPGPYADSGFRLVATACRPLGGGEVYVAFVFVEHDVLGLVAMLAPNADGGTLADGWTALGEQWRSAVPDPTTPSNEELGEVLLYQALFRRGRETTAGRLDAAVRAALPVAPGSLRAGHDRTRDGFYLWEAADTDAVAVHRTLAVLAPDTAERALDRWVWATAGHSGLMPFARYLLHAAKVRHAARVHRASAAADELVASSDEAVRSVLTAVRPQDAGWAPSLPDLSRAQQRLDADRLLPTGLLWRITRLRQLRRNVDTALENMRRHVPEVRRYGEGPTLFARDSGAAQALARQVDGDLVHLEAARERADAARAVVAEAVDRAVREHRERITLIQTSVLSAVVTALTTVQAFTYRLPVPAALQTCLVALSAALAFALPLVLLRWIGGVPAGAPYRWVDALAGGALGATATWTAVTLAARLAGYGVAPPGVSVPAALGVAAGVWVVTWRRGRTG